MATTDALASIEYIVAALGVNLVVVLGHQQCGAVSAAKHPGPYSENLSYLFSFIRPAFEITQPETVDDATMINAHHAAGTIKERSTQIARRAEAGTLRIVPAFYALDTGIVSWL